MEALIENEVRPAKRTAGITTSFIANYWGISYYEVQGVTGRVLLRALNQESQAFYGKEDPQLIGTVVNDLDPVSEEVLALFQARQDNLLKCALDGEKLYVRKLTTAKWYPYLGFVRCEAG